MDSSGDSVFDGSTPIPRALEQLRLRLLDLTGRNRLLNFKHSPGKSLPLVPSNIAETFSRLLAASSPKITIEPVPDPTRDDWVERNGRMGKPDAKDFAEKLGISTALEESGDHPAKFGAVRALYYADDLGKHCRKIEREARLAIEETGANMLHLVLGFLEYPDSRDAQRLFAAPLVCVPVKIEALKDARGVTFKISYTGDEIEENLSLREKLKRDDSVLLPDFPADEDGIEGYLKAIEEIVSKRPRWRVRRSMGLALLSFQNMLLVRDLDPEHWSDGRGSSRLLNHPVIKRVFEGGAEHSAIPYAAEHPLDDMQDVNYPLIFDADSSQHSAIVDVMAGKSTVIEGPPGTGKSQTITNIIAACLNSGKSVLFVAEKLAALQVVKSRLQAAGLDPFLLELHSNKTNRRQVLDSISSRLSYRVALPRDIDAKEASLEAKKLRLKEHATLLNSSIGNQMGCTVHQVLWRAEKSRQKIGVVPPSVAAIAVAAAPSTNAVNFQRQVDLLKYLQQHFAEIGTHGSEHPFWGFYPESLGPGDDIKIGNALRVAFESAVSLCDKTPRIIDTFCFEKSTSFNLAGVNQLIDIFGSLEAQLTLPAATEILENVFGHGREYQEKALLTLKWADALFNKVNQLEEEIDGQVDMERAASATLSVADLDGLQRLSLQHIELRKVPAMLRNLEARIQAARDALHKVRELTSLLKLGDLGDDRQLTKLRAVLEAAGTAPMSLLHLRAERLRSPGIIDRLTTFISAQTRLKTQEELLAKKLYLDPAPPDESLNTWVLTLRDGDAWYRFFQPSWRAAIKGHRALQRNKVSITAPHRLVELEELVDLRKAKAAWANTSVARELSDGNDPWQTDFAPHLAVASWLDEVRQRFEGAEIGTGCVDLLTMPAAQISVIRSRAPEIAELLAELDQLAQLLEEISPRQASALVRASWDEKVEQASSLFNLLQRINNGLNDAVRSDVDIATARRLLEAAHQVVKGTAELASSEELSQLLGVRHQRYAQEVSQVAAAMKFGRAVLKAPLATGTKRLLWTADASSVLDAIQGQLRSIRADWLVIHDELRLMASFGDLTEQEWIPPHSHDAPACERARLRFQRAIEGLDGLITWSQYNGARSTCREAGLTAFVELLEELQIPSEHLAEVFTYRFYATIAESLFRRTPALGKFSGAVHSSVQREFSELDRELIRLRGKQISNARVKRAKPPVGMSGARVADKTEMNLLEYLMPQQRPRVTVRDMLKRAGKSIQTIKPCFLMGPQAVAQFLSPTPEMFDVVIMDEASQLRPEEAIGAIARGRQLVVVGDPKQLPPTSFFSRAQDEDESEMQMAAVESESILDVASSHFRPIRSLRWHYRSRHESLIAFSNSKFYRDSLVIFPSPYPRIKGLGVRLHYVTNATYESQMNRKEAERVVDLVIEHILHTPDLSLGVVALNVRQRDLIAELLEERLKSVPGGEEYRSHWSETGESLFVKNLENVQGDERDAIIISTTFGPPPGGSKPRQNFGPISQRGGWRRLNVLFTRAKSAVVLVTSLRDRDIVVDGTTPEGTKALRDYLTYAATGTLQHDPGQATGGAPESEFEEAVIRALEERGYRCEPQVGVAGFRIDIGVRHPKYPHLYLAGIECDGATYHSGVTVRDRDRIRQDILENLGWRGKLWRIWSTEWFRNPGVELRKLVGFLDGLALVDVDSELAAIHDDSWANSSDDVSADDEYVAERENPEQLQILTTDAEREVSVGDFVTYIDQSSSTPEKLLSVQIAHGHVDLAAGVIAETSPLAQVLLGAVEGDEVILSVPGHRDRSLKIVQIKSATPTSGQAWTQASLPLA